MQKTSFALVLIVGITLFGSTNIDARSRYYRVNVDATHNTWYPGNTSSTYDIRIEEPFAVPRVPEVTTYNPCRYGCIRPDMVCANGRHIARVPDMFEKYQKLKRQRQQQRLLNAQTELLETQAALARYQLQQIEDAERYKRNQRLVYGDRTKQKRKSNSKPRVSSSESTRSTTYVWHEGKQRYVHHTRLKPKSHSHKPSVLSRLASKLGLKKSHRCTADCVD